MHEMLEHDASAIKVVARRQACFENQHGCRALGKSDPIEGSPDVPMRAQRVDADAGIPGMDQNLFVLPIPGIERAPAETSRAGHPGNRVLAGYPDGTMTLHAARAQAMPMRRPLPRALVVLIVGEEAHVDVAERDAEILMLRRQLAVALRERPSAHSRLTWPDRAWLALLAGTLPVERLAGLRLIVTPATILRWRRAIVRRRWARLSRRARSGRPPVRRNVRSVVLRLARENESWGYRRVHGELAALGITVAPSTVWQILKDAGIEPAPAGTALGGRSSCGRRRRGSWRWTSSPLTCAMARRYTSLR